MMNDYKKVAQDLAREAGVIMQRNFRNDTNTVAYKDDNTPITLADKEINDLVKETVGKTFPEHGFYGEEGGTPDGQRYIWICDPIDGTRSFARGIAASTFTLALLEDGEPILGIIFQPFLNELYSAVRGEGAMCNGEKISVSAKKEIDHETMIAAPAHKESAPHKIDHSMEVYAKKGANIYNFGSAAYNAALVARGSMDMTFFPWKSPWDVAAAKIIIEEAGGKTSDLFGDAQRYDAQIKGFFGSNKTLCTIAEIQ